MTQRDAEDTARDIVSYCPECAEAQKRIAKLGAENKRLLQALSKIAAKTDASPVFLIASKALSPSSSPAPSEPKTDRTIRAALIRWWKADTRWTEFTVAQPGTDSFRRIYRSSKSRYESLVKAKMELVLLAKQLALAKKGKR